MSLAHKAFFSNVSINLENVLTYHLQALHASTTDPIGEG